MTPPSCQSQLLFRVRRGLGSDRDRQALEAHLSSCEACRLLDQFERDFETEGDAQPGDAQRIARLAARVSQALERPQSHALRTPPRRAVRRTLPLALLGFATSAAAASGVVWFWGAREPQLVAPLAASGSIVVRAPSSAAHPLPHQSTASAAGAEEPPKDKHVAPSSSAKPKTSAATPPKRTVAELFQLASRARRAGDASSAIRYYRALLRDYPGSAEASLSRISLGNLLLETGAAAAALTEFNAYLRAPSGSMAAEAQYGRARALAALGRQAQELAAWKRLLADFPASPYATRARRRLGEPQ